MDIYDKEKRSEIMSKVRSKDTKPELIVRKALFAAGYRYRLHSAKLPGHPDIVLPKYKTVIFVNGCFWHGHEGCKKATLPTSNTDFWRKKISGNIERDHRIQLELSKQGWRLLVVWECETQNKTLIRSLISRISDIRLYQNYKPDIQRISLPENACQHL